MSLRRTALTRKTPLRSTSTGLAKTRKASLNRRTVKASARPRRDTGPTRQVREIVIARSSGCCEVCGARLRSAGQWVADFSIHHRRPRGMGGTQRPESNSPANLLLLCGSGTTGCHGSIESARAEAYEQGWLVGQLNDPRKVPALLRVGATRFLALLDDEGGITAVTP